jgi:hypothetical protein
VPDVVHELLATEVARDKLAAGDVVAELLRDADRSVA